MPGEEGKEGLAMHVPCSAVQSSQACFKSDRVTALLPTTLCMEDPQLWGPGGSGYLPSQSLSEVPTASCLLDTTTFFLCPGQVPPVLSSA